MPATKDRELEQKQIDTHQPGEFDREVVLKQSGGWMQGIIWTIAVVTVGLGIWAAISPLEEVVPAAGKLEPVGKVKDVQVPVGGVVKSVAVKDGDKVTKGQKLLSLEATVASSQLVALDANLTSLTAEVEFYRSVIAGKANAAKSSNLKLSPEILALTQNRTALLAENRLARAELNGTALTNPTAEQRQHLDASRAELASRLSAGRLDTDQIERQARENRNKRQGIQKLRANSQATIANINNKAQARQLQIAAQIAENRARQDTSKDLLESNQQILNGLKEATEAGAISRTQFIKQQQEVTTRNGETIELDRQRDKLQQDLQELLATSKLEIQNQQQQIAQYDNEISQLDQEYLRLGLAKNQSREKVNNSFQSSRKDLLTKIATTDRQIAEIDGQLNKTIVESERKIADLNSQIAKAKLDLKYQDIFAPASGTIFELKASNPGFVANPSEPILKIVPDRTLVAKVFITNRDIGFIKTGMTADVRLDTFPFSEYGDVKGKIIAIGSDALPADQQHPYERFPITIELAAQNLVVKGHPLTLQSGMSVSINIKTRNRTALNLLTDLIYKQNDELKSVK